MAIRAGIYSNVPSFPSSYYQSNGNISASGQTDVVVPAMDLDIGGGSYRLDSAATMSVNSDSSWDFGQTIGTWTANTSYSVGDWVRVVTQRQSELTTPVWDRLQQVTGTPPSTLDTYPPLFVGDFMYVLSNNNIHRLNLITNVWSGALTVTGTEPNLTYSSLVYHDGYLYLFGGYGPGNVTRRLNLATLAWDSDYNATLTGTPPEARFRHSAIVIGDYMYIYGGQKVWGGPYNTEIYRLNLVTSAWDDAFATGISGVPPATATPIIGEDVYNNNLYMFQYPGETFKLDLSTLVWSGALPITGTKPSRSTATCGISNGYFYIFGGWGGSALNDVQRLNLSTLVWSGVLTCRGNTPSPRNGPTGGFYSGYLYTFGGGVNDIHRLNTCNNIFSYKCTSSGTSLSSEPIWGTTVGGTTAESGGPTWTCYYDDTSATNRAGVDYYIYACQQDGLTPKILLSRNSTYPHDYTASNSRKIGGFHTLCGSVGTISGHSLTGYLTGAVLPYSVWDLKHRSASGSNIGQVYIPEINKWVGIYLMSGTLSAPTIVFGGTMLNTIPYFVSYDACRVLKGQLPKNSEFAVFAAGSNEATNILGSASPGTVTAAVDTAGRRMISNYGVECCSGVLLQWLGDTSYRFDAATTHTHTVTIATLGVAATTGNANIDVAPGWSYKAVTGGKGSLYTQGTYGVVKLFAGSNWASAADCGSLAGAALWSPWDYITSIGFRAVFNNIEK